MILHVTPKSAERRAFLRKVKRWTDAELVPVPPEEIDLDALSVAAAAIDTPREKLAAMLKSVEDAFKPKGHGDSDLPDNHPAMIATARAAELICAVPEWIALRDVESTAESTLDFPTASLPSPFREFVESAAAANEVDPAAIAAGVLGVTAAAASQRFRVSEPFPRAVERYSVVLNLFLVIVGKPSQRKSSAFKKSVELLKKGVEAARPAYEEQKVKNAAKERAIKAKIAGAENILKSVKISETDSERERKEKAERELEKLERELAAVKPPADPIFYTGSDTTPEGAVSKLVATNGTLLIADDEPTLFDILKGQYSKQSMGGNVSPLIQSLDGGSLNVTRAGREIYLEYANTTFLLCAQPASFYEFYSDKRLTGRGFVARCLPIYMKHTPHTARNAAIVDLDAKRQCTERLAEILAVPQLLEPPVIDWTPDAAEIVEDYCQEIYRTYDPGGSMYENDADSAFAGKQGANVWRLAAILHLLSEGTEAADVISANCARAAISVHRYFWNARAGVSADASRETVTAYETALKVLLSLTFDAPTIRGSCTLSEWWQRCRDKHRAIFGTGKEAHEHFVNEIAPELADLGYIYTAPRAKGRAVDVYLSPRCLTFND